MRRIEALTGPAAVDLLRRHDRALSAAGELLRVTPDNVPDTIDKLRQRVRELERGGAGKAGLTGVDVEELVGLASRRDGASVLVASVPVPDGKALLELIDRVRGKLGDAAIVLVAAGQDRVDLVASVAPSLVARGVRANEIVGAAARLVGGGGGGRDTMARAGGRDVDRVPEALEAARTAIQAALDGSRQSP